jgi:predicted enzyme related to lactoylglutathione lyase
MDLHLELVSVLVADVDRAKAFYVDQVGLASSKTCRSMRITASWSWRRPAPETYLGYAQGQNLDSPGGVAYDEPRSYVAPESLQLNTWAVGGNWTIEERASVLNEAGGRIAFRFHARDVHLV